MRTSIPFFLLAALLFTSALPTYAHGKLLVTEEVLIEYVDHRLDQLDGKEKLEEEQAAELNFIRENRDNLQALADFYEMRIKEKESVRISEREEPPAREIQSESEKAVTVEAIPVKISESQEKPPGFAPDEQVGEVRRTAEAEKTMVPKEMKADEKALSPIGTSLPPVKPETAIASQKPIPQTNQRSERKQADVTNEINEINQRDQTGQTDQINQPPQIAQLKLPSPVTEQEVRQFVEHYRKCYIQKDIDGFLSLFSYRAVQNGRDGFNEIRKIYSVFFDQSQELQYQLNGTRIQIYQEVLISGLFYENAAIAQARYKLDQIVKKNGKKKIWTGDVRWILVRENGALKILHLDFRHD